MLLRGGRRVCYIGRMETYLTLLLLGTALFVLEIFVPGGIAGLFGGLLCLLAAWKAVASFDGWIGLALALLAVVVACGMVFLVVRVFPSSSTTSKLPERATRICWLLLWAWPPRTDPEGTS